MTVKFRFTKKKEKLFTPSKNLFWLFEVRTIETVHRPSHARCACRRSPKTTVYKIVIDLKEKKVRCKHPCSPHEIGEKS